MSMADRAASASSPEERLRGRDANQRGWKDLSTCVCVMVMARLVAAAHQPAAPVCNGSELQEAPPEGAARSARQSADMLT
mmetsp:Transcript_36017/g.62571  ORF Transcript_36017/g.62571 Transcript_36017/m.62571 type:complete len:80 (+) Transcript_36017:438-677(+)